MSDNIITKKGRYYYSNGKRKTSVARVRLYPHGQGEITINNHPLNHFCKNLVQSEIIKSPLKLTGHGNDLDIMINVQGGGIMSQTDAIRHGITKTLVLFDPLLRLIVKKAGLLTRDSRIRERKKPGLKGPRRAEQWSKR